MRIVIPLRVLVVAAAPLLLLHGRVLAQVQTRHPRTHPVLDTSSRPQERSTAAIASAAAPATVTILALGSRGDTLGLGSGFLVRTDGVIVTNYHVLRGASRAIIAMPSRGPFAQVTVLGADSTVDLAVLKVTTDGLPGVPTLPTRTDLPNPGDRVVAIGSPYGLSQTVSDGIVSATRLMHGVEMVQITAPISPGSSGGAVLDTQGRVFAVSTERLVGGENLNFAVPVRYALELLQDAHGDRAVADVFAPHARSDDALAQIRKALQVGPDSALAAARQALAAGVGRDTIALLLIAPMGEITKTAQVAPSSTAWQRAYQFSLRVDSLAPSPNSKYFVGVTAFQTGLVTLTSINETRSCPDARLAETMWAAAAQAIAGGKSVDASTVDMILNAIQQYTPTIAQAKKRYC